MKEFHICTLVNDWDKYTAMKSSFLDAGFSEDRCRYSVFDNSSANRYEPYSTFNRVKASTTEPYLIFCHQDILLDRGRGIDDLMGALADLERRDPSWAVAGNSGMSDTLFEGICYVGPAGCFRSGNLPLEVYTLDESFLVVKTAAQVACSSDLSGFHLYATDLCFHARRNGHRCYVVDFELTHLSQRDPQSAGFYAAVKAFKQTWNRAFGCCFVRTMCTQFLLSRYALVRGLLDHPYVLAFFNTHRRTYRRLHQVCSLLRPQPVCLQPGTISEQIRS